MVNRRVRSVDLVRGRAEVGEGGPGVCPSKDCRPLETQQLRLGRCVYPGFIIKSNVFRYGEYIFTCRFDQKKVTGSKYVHIHGICEARPRECSTTAFR